jgi:DNA-binding response OmpR family regulator
MRRNGNRSSGPRRPGRSEEPGEPECGDPAQRKPCKGSRIDIVEKICSWSDVPIIILSIQSDEDTKVRMLKLGADHYVVKPFRVAELAARCEVALRRYHKSEDRNPVVRTAGLAVDVVTRSVVLSGR